MTGPVSGLLVSLPVGWAEPLTFLLMLGGFAALTMAARWPIGVALVAAAWLGSAANGDLLPLRHLIEGAFAYLDPILIIATAMILMRALADGGALAAVGSAVERRLAGRPLVLLPLVMLIIMFPAMITGSSTASVLTTGAMAVAILGSVGVSLERAAAMVAMGGVIGVVAPPINIPAMIIGGGIDLPYVGFEVPMAVVAFPVAVVIAYQLGWEAVRSHRNERRSRRGTPLLAGPTVPLRRAFLAPLVAAVLLAGPRTVPSVIPDVGLPLAFLLAAVTAVAVLPRFSVPRTLMTATQESLPVLAILCGVGAFIQIMTVTGARGWLVSLMVGAPAWAIFAAAAVGLPIFGAVSSYGSASVLGVPFLLVLLGRDEVVTTTALSLLAALGDLMLPAALAATLAARAAGIADRLRVIKQCVVPAVITIAVAVLMLVFSADIGRWIG